MESLCLIKYSCANKIEYFKNVKKKNHKMSQKGIEIQRNGGKNDVGFWNKHAYDAQHFISLKIVFSIHGLTMKIFDHFVEVVFILE